jgi:digalactosyldiacylglycerol synthase
MGTKKNPQPVAGGGRDGGAFAFISKGWREARDSATADLSLMRERADRELAHLIAASASALAGPGTASRPFAELDFVRKRIQPKITELRRQCSSTVLEGWPPRAGASLRVDLSGLTAIRNAIVADGQLRVAPWKGGKGRAEWDVVSMVRSGLKEFDRRSLLSSEMLGGFRGRSEFLDKLKLSLVNSTMAFNNEMNR